MATRLSTVEAMLATSSDTTTVSANTVMRFASILEMSSTSLIRLSRWRALALIFLRSSSSCTWPSSSTSSSSISE